jgi:hypothetical protein
MRFWKKENLCLKENNLYLQPQNFQYMQARFIRNLLVLCMSIAISHTTSAQNAARDYVEPDGWSLGTNLGMSDLWGSVGTKSVIDHYSNSKYFDKVAFMGGVFGRYTIHPCLSVRLMLNYGTLYATDKWNYDKGKNSADQSTDAYQRLARNQDAKDIIFEPGVLFELDPFRFNPESRGAMKRGQPYIALGITYFHYTPYSTAGNTGSWVKTYDLDLEGQGFGAGFPPKKPLWQLGIPLAIGYRWDIGQHLNLGIEYMYRLTFSKYLDGVSGTYISKADFAAHLSAHDATAAEVVADKEIYTGLGLPNAAGNTRGGGKNESYSTIGITFYYKIATNNRRWWK